MPLEIDRVDRDLAAPARRALRGRRLGLGHAFDRRLRLGDDARHRRAARDLFGRARPRQPAHRDEAGEPRGECRARGPRPGRRPRPPVQPFSAGIEDGRLGRARPAPLPASPTGVAPEGGGPSRDSRTVVDRRLDTLPDPVDVEALDRVGHAAAQEPLHALAIRELGLARAAVRDVERGLAHGVAVELAVEVTVEQFVGLAAVHANSWSRFCSFLRA